LRRNAGISISSIPVLASASTFAAACERALRHTLGVFRLKFLQAFRHRAVEVDVDGLGESPGLVLGTAADDASAVDHHVQFAQAFHQRAHGVAVTHVELLEREAHHRSVVRDRGRHFAVGRAGGGDGITLPGEGTGDARADAARAPGDQHPACTHEARSRVAHTSAAREIAATAP
jgi:hypothetical protein